MLISQTRSGLRDQLALVSNYRHVNEIKFNPEKTVFLIFNKKVIMSLDDRWLDAWQGELYLSGNPITEVDRMKYLGVQITNKNRNEEHFNTRNARHWLPFTD